VAEAQRFVAHRLDGPDVQGLRLADGRVYADLPGGPLARSCLDATGLVRDLRTGARTGWVTWEGRPPHHCCSPQRHGPVDRDPDWPYGAALAVPRRHLPAPFPARFLIISGMCADHVGVRFLSGRVLADSCDGPLVEAACAEYAAGAFGDRVSLVWERDRWPQPCCPDAGHERPGAWTWRTAAWPDPPDALTFQRVIRPAL
jgi:hypothetical protein